ncbi:MAG: hypothetical protein AAF842_10220 [Planctomycetota bacterium]
MAKRNSIPPYEIMGRRPAEPDDESAGADAGTASSVPSSEDPPRGPRSGGLGEPIVLRVPRGLAVVAMVGVLGLIVSGYAAGQRRGYAAGEEAARALAEEELRETARLLGRTVDGAMAAGRGEAAAVDGVGPGEVYREPRRRGLRYFVISHEPPEEAAKLIAFVERLGVDAAAVPSDNPRFVKVIATQGFTADELRSATGRDYEQALRRIGRAWQDANNGGKNLSDLYPELYEG